MREPRILEIAKKKLYFYEYKRGGHRLCGRLTQGEFKALVKAGYKSAEAPERAPTGKESKTYQTTYCFYIPLNSYYENKGII